MRLYIAYMPLSINRTDFSIPISPFPPPRRTSQEGSPQGTHRAMPEAEETGQGIRKAVRPLKRERGDGTRGPPFLSLAWPGSSRESEKRGNFLSSICPLSREDWRGRGGGRGWGLLVDYSPGDAAARHRSAYILQGWRGLAEHWSSCKSQQRGEGEAGERGGEPRLGGVGVGMVKAGESQ